jgi:hypothetical protein
MVVGEVRMIGGLIVGVCVRPQVIVGRNIRALRMRDTLGISAEGTKSDCGVRNQSLDVRSTTLLVRQFVGSHCA